MLDALGQAVARKQPVLLLRHREEEAFLIAELAVESRQRATGQLNDVIDAGCLIAFSKIPHARLSKTPAGGLCLDHSDGWVERAESCSPTIGRAESHASGPPAQSGSQRPPRRSARVRTCGFANTRRLMTLRAHCRARLRETMSTLGGRRMAHEYPIDARGAV
jgi:hypothetical protein